MLGASLHILYIMCKTRAALSFSSVRSLSKIEFLALKESEHNNASEASAPVAFRKRVQRYGDFLNWQNFSGLFLRKMKKKGGEKEGKWGGKRAAMKTRYTRHLKGMLRSPLGNEQPARSKGAPQGQLPFLYGSCTVDVRLLYG